MARLLLRGAVLAGVVTTIAGSILRSRKCVLSHKASLAAPCLPYASSSHKRCLLISNSKLAGLGYLEHVLEHICSFLGARISAGEYVVFVPYAQRDRDSYFAKFSEAFAATGYSVRSLHKCADAEECRATVCGASAIFVGGGNTYRLLKCLQQDPELLPLIVARVASGKLAYIGSSAGTNIACPTIRNTNDMPIVWPEAGLGGLCLVPFQINTHYIDEARELKNHMGETRAVRIKEFVEENDVPVLCLREGASVLVEGEEARLLGPAKRSAAVFWEGARLVRRMADGGVREVAADESLNFLMSSGAPPALLFDNAPLMTDEGQAERQVARSITDDAFKSG
mmetsp:Transcript_19486/g.44789  ORF Transcript_19486/g.44789 Transcript_19486/m.44789 type:complete len:340 (-) Transcript_19486:671-1690(-)